MSIARRLATRRRVAAAFAAGLLGLAGATQAAPAPAAGRFVGPAVGIGHGNARVVVHADAGGNPTAVSVELSAGALAGLPARPDPHNLPEGHWGYVLAMPAHAPATGIDHVEIDWNPHGHPPEHVYTVPHFDIHFYTISRAQQAAIRFHGSDDPGLQAPRPELLPADYKFIPQTAVHDMGVHAVDLRAPEFHGQPFTATFIYGYYQGRLSFLEPMVTRAFLRSQASMHADVRTPANYSSPGMFPSRYEVRYDAATRRHVIELGGLRPATVLEARAGS